MHDQLTAGKTEHSFYFSDKCFKIEYLFFVHNYSTKKYKLVIFLNVTNSSADDDQILARRYAESTLASDMSKIMDSLVQKNFVNYLLNHREKRSEYV